MVKFLSTESIDNQQLRSLNKYGYLYVTTNLINGKKYVGVHKCSSDKLDINYKGSGKYLWRAINKYGWSNFETEIIEWYDTKEELYQAEVNYIKRHDCVNSNDYYNTHDGGYGGVAYINLPEDEYNAVIKKISDKKSNRPRTDKELQQLDNIHKSRIGTHMSDLSKEKSRQSNLGQTRSVSAKQNMSDNHADFNGTKNPAFGRKWINNGIEQLYVKDPELSDKLSSGYVLGQLKKKR